MFVVVIIVIEENESANEPTWSEGIGVYETKDEAIAEAAELAAYYRGA